MTDQSDGIARLVLPGHGERFLRDGWRNCQELWKKESQKAARYRRDAKRLRARLAEVEFENRVMRDLLLEEYDVTTADIAEAVSDAR
jgi:hypothetical protein